MFAKPAIALLLLHCFGASTGFHQQRHGPPIALPPSSPGMLVRPLALKQGQSHDFLHTSRGSNQRSGPTCLRVAPIPVDLGMVGGASAASASANPGSSPLMTYFLQSLISSGVPALFTVAVIGFAALMFRRGRGRDGGHYDDDEAFDNPNSPVAALYNDLYGDQASPGSTKGRGGALARFLSGRGGGGRGGPKRDEELPTNVGVPGAEYLRLHHLNRQYDSYEYSIAAATQSKAAAAARYRQASLRRALSKSLWDLSLPEWQELQELERDFLREAAPAYEQWQEATRAVTQARIDHVLEDLGLDSVYQIDPSPSNSSATRKSAAAVNATTATGKAGKAPSKPKKRSVVDTKALESRVQRLEKQLSQLEWDFVSELLHVVGPSHATSVRTALLGDAATRGVVPGRLVMELRDRPLTALLGEKGEGDGANAAAARRPVLYVCRFPGDATASQVEFLREEVTAIVRHAKEGDEALVILQTGGGTVTGYGLAASQLVRLKSKLRLTIAVEQVAASGGYMMCCVADRIVASPFAVLGSIGVISDIPNVYERLKKEGIEFQTVTAGKYKRTLTPTKKVTKEDFEKTKEDIEDVLVLFRNFVAANRPQLDMEQVATGETWFGKDALDRKLCDEIKPVDDVITEYVDAGFDVFEVEYAPPEEEKSPLAQLLPVGSIESGADGGLLRRGVRWLVQAVASEVQAEFGPALDSRIPVEKRILARSDDADRVRSQ